MSETPERAFTIDGQDYPIPALVSFTMDEAVVFYDNNGYPVEELWLVPDEDDADGLRDRLDKFRHPAIVKTMLHVAYRRGNPGTSNKAIAEVVGSVPLASALVAFIPDDDVEDEAVPLGRTSEPVASSPASSPGGNASSGTGSTIGSDEPVTVPSPTGTIRSGTSRTFDPVTSAA